MNLGEPKLIDEACPAAAGGAPDGRPHGVAWGWIALLGFGHLVVELGCSYAFNRTLDATELGAGAVLLYNAVAFWGQIPLGWAADRWRGARTLAATGALLVVAGLIALTAEAPWVTVALLALGNGCYHIGGGVFAIRQSRGRLGGLGLFVGPGAVGLTLGVGLARTEFSATPWVLGGLVVALAWWVWRLGSADSGVGACSQATPVDGRRADRLQAGSYTRTVVVVALVLACIAIRSFVGTGFSFAWGGNAAVVLALAAALALGKSGGGFLADRFGWLRATIAVLALSVLALWFGQDLIAAGLIGVALFQAPMAVTLGALVWTLPRRPGLAFGLASGAVYAGGFPLLAGDVRWLHSFAGLTCLSGVAVLMLAVGLWGKASADSCR